MDTIDYKYVSILSSKLGFYKIKENHPYKANFRCPLCGDSKKSKTKCRGWLTQTKNTIFYKCFNCGTSLTLYNFIKTLDPFLCEEYEKEKILQKFSGKSVGKYEDQYKEIKQTDYRGVLKTLRKVSSLPSDHPAKEYVIGRKIPPETHFKLFYADNFERWVNTIIPDKFSCDTGSPRIILPCFDKNKNLLGFQGRSIGESTMRYLTITLDKTQPLLFGLDSVDMSKKYFVLEGPIDSLFLPNSIALMGASKKNHSLNRNAVFVFDFEPRNKNIVNLIRSVINQGHRVFIPPREIIEKGKDINDLILSGLTQKEIISTIDKNTYMDIEAELKLSHWRKD